MGTVAVVLALVAATAFAFGTVLQQKGTLQAVAWHEGSLVVVQSVTTLSLVIALPTAASTPSEPVRTGARTP